MSTKDMKGNVSYSHSSGVTDECDKTNIVRLV